MLSELIQKDIRLCRLPIVAVVAALLASFAMATVIVSQTPEWSDGDSSTAWAAVLATGAYFAAVSAQATLAMVSGSLIAAERSDRSAEFLAYLPPSRALILTSKLIVLGGSIFFVWWTAISADTAADWLAGDDESVRFITSRLAPLSHTAAATIAIIGTGFGASARFASPGLCVVLAVLSAMPVTAALVVVQLLTGWPGASEFRQVHLASYVAFGFLMMGVGSAHFVRRMEP